MYKKEIQAHKALSIYLYTEIHNLSNLSGACGPKNERIPRGVFRNHLRFGARFMHPPEMKPR